MKKIVFFTAMLVMLPGTLLMAQDIQARIDEAKSAYKSGSLDDARFALQEALNEINQAIGKEILDLLPSEMNGLKYNDSLDDVSGSSAGYAGVYLNREYTAENKNATVEIVSDSPMLAGINSLLSMPAFMGSSQGQKRIKVHDYKALLTRSDEEGGSVSYDIQMPFGSSLLTFTTSGIAEEKEVVDMVNGLPIDQIVKLAE